LEAGFDWVGDVSALALLRSFRTPRPGPDSGV
jgi:hypothetical protein